MSVVKRYKNLEFWAEGGKVYLLRVDRAENLDEDKKADEMAYAKVIKGLEPKEFLKRAILAGSFALRYWDEYKSEAKKVRDFLVDAQEVYKKALEQNPPQKTVQLYIPSSFYYELKPKKRGVGEDIIEDIMLEGYE